MVRMRTSDVCVRIHSAERMRIGSVESRAVLPRAMRVLPNQEARFLSEAKSELIMKRGEEVVRLYVLYLYIGCAQPLCKRKEEGRAMYTFCHCF